MKCSSQKAFVFTLALAVSSGAALAAAGLDTNSVRSACDVVSYCRGLEFKQPLPVDVLTSNKLAEILGKEFQDAFGADRIEGYEEVYSRWMGLLPEGFDLKGGMNQLMQEQVAGLYDHETKTMYVAESCAAGDRRRSKGEGAGELPVVLAHEAHHALEDLHFDFAALEKKVKDDNDGTTALQCVLEGSATRGMLEALPALVQARNASSFDAPEYFESENFIRLPVVESTLLSLARNPARLLRMLGEGSSTNLPPVLLRDLVQSYLYGYRFVRTFSRDYGNDALNRIYAHIPVTTEQILHPEKYWAWRDLPVEISLPTNAPGGWSVWVDDTLGEADLRTFFDLHLGDGRGSLPAEGWDGGRIALYRNADGKRLFVWATAWDSAHTARRFEQALRRVWRTRMQCKALSDDPVWQWMRKDERVGTIKRIGLRVFLFETDAPAAWNSKSLVALRRSIKFSEPDDEPYGGLSLVRCNPLLAYRRDRDYVTTSLLAGILYRHDGNAVGARDHLLAGWLLRWARSDSWREFTLAHGWLIRHRADRGRDYATTRLLPWGLLWSDDQTRSPFDEAVSHRYNRIAWGILSTYRRDGEKRSFRLLPWGALLRYDTDAKSSSTRVLGIPLFGKRFVPTDAHP